MLKIPGDAVRQPDNAKAIAYLWARKWFVVARVQRAAAVGKENIVLRQWPANALILAIISGST